MSKNKKLELGSVVKINSPERLGEVHLMKGFVSAYSHNDNGDIAAYSIDINGECWFAFVDEVIETGKFVDPNINMTDSIIKVDDEGNISNSD